MAPSGAAGGHLALTLVLPGALSGVGAGASSLPWSAGAVDPWEAVTVTSTMVKGVADGLTTMTCGR